MVVTLPPATYSAQPEGATGDTGIAPWKFIFFLKPGVSHLPNTMIPFYRILLTTACLFSLTSWLSAQTATPAPLALPTSLIQYTSTQALTNLSTARLIAYNSDLSYVEISSSYISFTGSGTQLPSKGTYTYSVDPQNSAHATIIYKSSNGISLNNDELYFFGQFSGSQIAPGGANSLGPNISFVIYPSQQIDGGANLSSLAHISTGDSITSGFVIESGGSRWVLLRAVSASLSEYDVSPTDSTPSLVLYDSNEKQVGKSAVWSADPNLISGFQAVFALVGAFQLNSGSDEGVLLLSLQPGAYTAVTSAIGTGSVLSEVYILPF